MRLRIAPFISIRIGPRVMPRVLPRTIRRAKADAYGMVFAAFALASVIGGLAMFVTELTK